MRTYADGETCFLENHYYGWFTIVVNFVNDRPYWRDNYSDVPIEKLPDASWGTEHLLYAGNQGHQDALKELERLIKEYGEGPLRRRLSTIPWYRAYVKYLWPLALSLVVLVAVTAKIVRRKRNVGNADTV